MAGRTSRRLPAWLYHVGQDVDGGLLPGSTGCNLEREVATMKNANTLAIAGLMIALLFVGAPTTAVESSSLVPISFTVPADGLTYGGNFPAGLHIVEVSGTYRLAQESGRTADAEYSNESGPCTEKPGTLHDLTINGQDVAWGDCLPEIHTYFTTVLCTSPCTLGFRIVDDHYSDNSGFLNVTVSAMQTSG